MTGSTRLLKPSGIDVEHPIPSATIEQRASILPCLPSSNPTKSYWQDPPSNLSTYRRSDHIPTSCHTLIIGSGITGATLAYHLSTSFPTSSPVGHNKVLMLEARTACSGATGRNGGHTKPHSYREFPHNVSKLGIEEASKIARLKHACFKQQHAFALEHGIDCDSWTGETVDIFYDEANWVQAQRGVIMLREALGENDEAAQYRLWDRRETEERFLVEGEAIVGAISYPAGSLNAYKLGIGVLELAIEKGLDLQTETPVERIEKVDSGDNKVWQVYTPRGCVLAERVVLATNGYSAHLYPPLTGTIVPMRGHMTVQRPPSGLPPGTLRGTCSFIYEDGYEYMIPRPTGTKDEGSICIGGGTTKGPDDARVLEYGTTDDTMMDPMIFTYLKNSAAGYFGFNWGKDASKGRILQAWTGIMGYSADGFPLVGKVPDMDVIGQTGIHNGRGDLNLWIAASFQGSGMVMCFMAAKALSLMMSETNDDKAREWLPEAWLMGKHRLGRKFQGRLHTVAPKNLEANGQT